MIRPRLSPTLRCRQRGAVAVVVGLTIFVLVGMIGLALDLGQMFVNKTELQNAADACALAAARELDGNADALDPGRCSGIDRRQPESRRLPEYRGCLDRTTSPTATS
jgi:Flp pilus assembly protein TadG